MRSRALLKSTRRDLSPKTCSSRWRHCGRRQLKADWGLVPEPGLSNSLTFPDVSVFWNMTNSLDPQRVSDNTDAIASRRDLMTGLLTLPSLHFETRMVTVTSRQTSSLPCTARKAIRNRTVANVQDKRSSTGTAARHFHASNL
jgi:hypothetical protein